MKNTTNPNTHFASPSRELMKFKPKLNKNQMEENSNRKSEYNRSDFAKNNIDQNMLGSKRKRRPFLPIYGTQYEEDYEPYQQGPLKKQCIRCNDQVYEYIYQNLDKIEGASSLLIDEANEKRIKFSMGPNSSITLKRGLRESVTYETPSSIATFEDVNDENELSWGVQSNPIYEDPSQQNSQYSIKYDSNNRNITVIDRSMLCKPTPPNVTSQHTEKKMDDSDNVDDVIYPIVKYEENTLLKKIIAILEGQMLDDTPSLEYHSTQCNTPYGPMHSQQYPPQFSQQYPHHPYYSQQPHQNPVNAQQFGEPFQPYSENLNQQQPYYSHQQLGWNGMTK